MQIPYGAMSAMTKDPGVNKVANTEGVSGPSMQGAFRR